LTSAQSFPGAGALKFGREYVAEIYAGETAGVWKNMTPEMQAAMKTESDFAHVAASINSQLGKETSSENERVMPGPHAQISLPLEGQMAHLSGRAFHL